MKKQTQDAFGGSRGDAYFGHHMAQQYSIQKGIKLFGDEGHKSVNKELQQLHDMQTYEPVHAHELTREQRKEALSSLMFMMQKRCGRVKSRACVNGSKQREWIRKEDAASPTVMTDSVMLTSLIEAHEYRKVITLDIPGAFLHTDIDEEVVIGNAAVWRTGDTNGQDRSREVRTICH